MATEPHASLRDAAGQLVRGAAGVVGLAAELGRQDLARAGAVSPETWALADGALDLLVDRLGELEAVSARPAGSSWRAGR